MRVVLELKPEVEEAFRQKVSVSGLDINDYVSRLILNDDGGYPLCDQMALDQECVEDSKKRE